MSTKPSDAVSQEAANAGNPTASMTLPADASKDTAAADAEGERKSSWHLPLFREPLSYHPPEEKVAAMRAAIEAGADVHQMDQEPIVGHNLGRPLDACLKGPVVDNIPAIELLLQHGADPRLGARPTLFAPVRRARYYAENHPEEEARTIWKRVLALFDEAILKLESEERKNEAGKA